MLAQYVAYFLFRPGNFVQKEFSQKLEKNSFIWRLKGLVSFLIVKSKCRATNTPSMPIIYINTSSQNFEIGKFSVSEWSGNYVFEDDNPSPALRAGGLQFMP